MSQRITIEIKDKIATCLTELPVVCGNADYIVDFVFDEEWEKHEVKTAMFIVNGKATPQVFTGTVCPVPVIQNTLIAWVGVFAGTVDDGTLSTSTPALVKCVPCVTDGDNVPMAPPNDVYNKIIALIESGMLKGEQGEKGDTPVRGVDYWTDEDKAEILKDIESGIAVTLELVQDSVWTSIQHMIRSLPKPLKRGDTVYIKEFDEDVRIDRNYDNSGFVFVGASDKLKRYINSKIGSEIIVYKFIKTKSAEKATSDEYGNRISTTYAKLQDITATKEELKQYIAAAIAAALQQGDDETMKYLHEIGLELSGEDGTPFGVTFFIKSSCPKPFNFDNAVQPSISKLYYLGETFVLAGHCFSDPEGTHEYLSIAISDDGISLLALCKAVDEDCATFRWLDILGVNYDDVSEITPNKWEEAY